VRWFADECVDAGLVRRLCGAGHDVVYVPEFASGMTDAEVLRRAYDEHRLLVTEDKDFGEIVFRLHLPVPGLVLLRVDPERHLLKWVRLESAVQRFGQRLFGRYAVLKRLGSVRDRYSDRRNVTKARPLAAPAASARGRHGRDRRWSRAPLAAGCLC
jgi:predicted nuclease of predicted toxin-antitoxin system